MTKYHDPPQMNQQGLVVDPTFHIGFLSSFSRWHTEPEIAHWLRRFGARVDCWHYDGADLEAFLARRYDLVLTSLPQWFPLDLWSRVEAPLVAWYFDWIRDWNREAAYVPALRHFALTLSTDGFDNGWYAERGIRRRWLPQACDTRFFFPMAGREKYACDVAFVGHAYLERRADLIRQLGRSFDFRHFGEASDVYGTEHARICNSAKILVADNYRNDIPGYWSDRVYLEVGSGGFLLHPRVPGIEESFTDGEHLVLYDDLPDLHDKIRYYLSHDDEREHVQRHGWRHVHQHHSQQARVRELMQTCESTLGVELTCTTASRI